MKDKEIISELQAKIKLLERQNAEHLSLFDKGEVSLFKWNNDETWSTAYASKNVYELLGYSSKEFLNKEIDYSEIIYKDDFDTVYEEVTYALNNNIDYFTHTAYRVVTKSGSIKWVLDNTYMVRDAEGEVTYFLGTISDITMLKNYELNLEKMVQKKTDENLLQKEVLYRQNRLVTIGETIESVAHQWRQPLNHVGANISKLEMLNTKELHKEALEKIVENSNNALEYMSKTITDFSNYFSPNKEKVRFLVQDVLNNSISIISPLLKNIDIVFENDAQGIELYGHENELMQVIVIMLNNAKDSIALKQAQESFQGKILVKLSLEESRAYISIEDNGNGIEDSIIYKIYEPYFTTKFKSQGTGLGLYMSKMIIEKEMNGSIEVSNTQNGAIFKIILGHK